MSSSLLPFQDQVLYEDNHVCVVLKPVGLITQDNGVAPHSLQSLTKDWLKAKYEKPGNVYLGLIHRLDKPVSGLVIFGKTSKGASRLSEQFRTHRVTKKYLTIVEGEVVEDSKELKHYLTEEALPKIYVSQEPKDGHKEARLRYLVKGRKNGFSLLEVELFTGRRHQIRVQLSTIGHPILGDRKYGSSQDYANDAIALVSHQLSFFHAVESEKRIDVEMPETKNGVLRRWNEIVS